jgi:hypothetical protein
MSINANDELLIAHDVYQLADLASSMGVAGAGKK